MANQNDHALAAALMRAETAEAYLQQAEARIEELEQLVHELASKVPASQLNDVRLGDFGIDFGQAEGRMQRFMEEYPKADSWRRQFDSLPDHQQRKLLDAFRNKWFDYDVEGDEYRRKPIDPDRRGTDRFRREREDEFQREFQALGHRLPTNMRKEAEKYLNDFLGNGALGKRQADEFEERKTGGVPGARYRLQFFADQPGSVEVRVENTANRLQFFADRDAKYWAMRLPDNVQEDELRKMSTKYGEEVFRGLNIGGNPDEAKNQLAADIFHGYVDMKKRGSMRHAVER